jgi:hypothetical protein
MTGVEKFLKDIKSYNTRSVTFGDGAKREILGIGNLANTDLPKLKNVLLVKGLTANLVSINQLCDQGFSVNFTKSECLVTNDIGEMLMKGTRSNGNCYLWVPQESEHHSTGLINKEDEVRQWNQKLGHPNLRGMKNATSVNTIKGLPNLKINKDNIYDECQIRKQTRMSHHKL